MDGAHLLSRTEGTAILAMEPWATGPCSLRDLSDYYLDEGGYIGGE